MTTNFLKRALGVIWLLLGPCVICFLAIAAFRYIDPHGKQDINNVVVWAIIISIFTPVAIGLMIFGWYALKGEYDRLPEKSAEL